MWKNSSNWVKREFQPPWWPEDIPFLDPNNARKKIITLRGCIGQGYECLWTPYYAAVTTAAAPATVFKKSSNCICNNSSSSYINWGQHRHNNNRKNNSSCSSIHNDISMHKSTSSIHDEPQQTGCSKLCKVWLLQCDPIIHLSGYHCFWFGDWCNTVIYNFPWS